MYEYHYWIYHVIPIIECLKHRYLYLFAF